jgi:hypothetical protein
MHRPAVPGPRVTGAHHFGQDGEPGRQHDHIRRQVGQGALRRALEEAGIASSLAEEPSAREALHDLLLRIRLG